MPALFSNLAVNTILDTIAAQMNGGKVVLYSGVEPTTANSALAGNASLADIAFANPAFGASAVAGGFATITANPMTLDPSANTNGDAKFFRGLSSGGAVVIQGSVGTGNEDMQVASATITVGQTIGVSALAISMPVTAGKNFSAGFSSGFA